MLNKPQLFGTDGVRGVAGEYPLDRDTVVRLGAALGAVLATTTAPTPEVVLGRDTRESGPEIVRALAAGLRASGVRVAYAGVITTPGISLLARRHGFAAGVMVSASHNPFQDNGIKVLSAGGVKLAESVELQIECALEKTSRIDVAERDLVAAPELLDEYLDFLESLVSDGASLPRFPMVVDCANGSASLVAPKLFERLGVQIRLLCAAPDGRNINSGCGSLFPQTVAAETRSGAAGLGVAFDGDADRSIFAAPSGRILDGDHVLYGCAPFMKERSELRGEAVVGTLMTNFGLELSLREHGIGLKRTPVGDRFVFEEMQRSDINLGGEPSGHIIFSSLSPAGDGLLTTLEILRLLSETGLTPDELVRDYHPLPQLIRNVRVVRKVPFDTIPEVQRALANCQADLDGRGRVVLRYSGTEPLARVMVEGERANAIEQHAAAIAAAIHRTLGAGAPS